MYDGDGKKMFTFCLVPVLFFVCFSHPSFLSLILILILVLPHCKNVLIILPSTLFFLPKFALFRPKKYVDGENMLSTYNIYHYLWLFKIVGQVKVPVRVRVSGSGCSLISLMLWLQNFRRAVVDGGK